ncbi:MAG: SusC/RagA family TonB-linked outer membrane protein [Bacteroidia bacterium]|nr:SusC/RagA family TonB-linked outer membrane protein [Bacteroidia bacterium]
MRFNNIYKKIRFAGLIMLIAILSLPVSGQEKKEKKAKQLFDVVLKVVDANGTAIPDANVVVGEGITHAVTDANGSVSLKGYADDVVTITAHNFEKSVSPVIDLLQNTTVTLSQAKLYMTSDDNVPLPFTTLKKRNLSGPEIVIPGSYFARYPSTDIRNTLTGISSMIDVREMDGSPGMSPLEGLQQYSSLSNSYNSTDKFSGMPYVMVDGVPADLQEYVVDPAEIESVTLMKGILGNAMYGPAATGGVLYIKTKQGVKNERILHVDLESGVSIVDRMPEFVSSGAVYARMQNTARAADGLPTAYSHEAIGGYALNNSYDLKYPSTDFKDMLLDNTMPFSRVNMSSSGGNDIVQYYSYIGYAHEGDIINLGAKSDYNRITARQNVTVKITDMIKAQFGFYGNLTFRRSPNYGYDSDYTTEGTGNETLNVTELPSILTDIRNTPPVAYPVWAMLDTTTKPATPWYGVSALYTSNIVGNIVDQGYYTDRGRTGASNLTLTFDFDKWVKGLKSTTYFGFNIHNTVRLGKENDYLAYSVKNPDAVKPLDRVTKFTGHSLTKMTDLYKLMDYYFQRFMFFEELSYGRTFGSSSIDLNAIYHQLISYINGIEEPYRQRSIVGTLMYSLKDKYAIQAAVNYSGNSSFAKDYRNMVNWSVGGSWVLSDESFMPDIKFIDYIKLRAQGGVVANETYFPNLYDVDRWSSSSGSNFGANSSLTWFGSAVETPNRIYLSRLGNPKLTFEKRREINAGLDLAVLDNRLTLGVTYYNWLVDGSISQIQYNLPLLAGYAGTRPYYNYNQTRYNAVGSDLTFAQKFGDIMLTVGGNATWSRGIRVKYDEPDYRNDYQVRTGKISDAIFGYTYIGKFESDEAAQGANGIPLQLFDATLHKGDLQYKDMNGDGFVDDIDQSVIGHSNPRLYYGINITLNYKNFDLFILGAGRAFYDIALTNAYYWNGWGDNNYSNFVHDNINGAYPRLTYYKVNNNFVTSDFWLTKGSYFKIQNVELAYTIPAKMLKFMGSRGIRLYVRGANLLTFSKVKDVDPESINSGVTVYPLFRTFSGGVKFNF